MTWNSCSCSSGCRSGSQSGVDGRGRVAARAPLAEVRSGGEDEGAEAGDPRRLRGAGPSIVEAPAPVPPFELVSWRQFHVSRGAGAYHRLGPISRLLARRNVRCRSSQRIRSLSHT